MTAKKKKKNDVKSLPKLLSSKFCREDPQTEFECYLNNTSCSIAWLFLDSGWVYINYSTVFNQQIVCHQEPVVEVMMKVESKAVPLLVKDWEESTQGPSVSPPPHSITSRKWCPEMKWSPISPRPRPRPGRTLTTAGPMVSLDLARSPRRPQGPTRCKQSQRAKTTTLQRILECK